MIIIGQELPPTGTPVIPHQRTGRNGGVLPGWLPRTGGEVTGYMPPITSFVVFRTVGAGAIMICPQPFKPRNHPPWVGEPGAPGCAHGTASVSGRRP